MQTMSGTEGSKAESFRLDAESVRWLHDWLAESGQDRTTFFRAATRLMIMVADNIPFDDRVRLIARLAANDRLNTSTDSIRTAILGLNNQSMKNDGARENAKILSGARVVDEAIEGVLPKRARADEPHHKPLGHRRAKETG